MFDLIAFDADDTLWENETNYHRTQDKFIQLLSRYHSREWIEKRLYETEMRNMQPFGYGVKAFVLSMIETAVELTEGRIQGTEIQRIIDYGKEMLHSEVQLLEGVEETINELSKSYELMIITKGDLIDQQTKIARSGLAGCFRHVEVVSHKTAESYRAILSRYQVDPSRFVMIGNSLKSDVLPVVELGGAAVYIPHHLTWAHETVAEADPGTNGYYELENIRLLPAFLTELGQGKNSR